jgi:hypothetical protein
MQMVNGVLDHIVNQLAIMQFVRPAKFCLLAWRGCCVID